MAKEKFLIIAQRMPNGCFGRFDEDENRAALDAYSEDTSDPYSWVEASFELMLVRHREATHICSFTPSARQHWLQNYFVGIPNAAWEDNGDPDGLEYENGGESPISYGTYRDEYDPRFIVETFTVDSVKDCGIRKPAIRSRTLSRRTDKEVEALDKYTETIWEVATEMAMETQRNGLGEAPILNVWTFRQWEREALKRRRERGGHHLFA